MRLVRRFTLVLLAALLAAAALASPAFAKDYHIASIDMRSVVSDDGTMSVTETREVTFNGAFSWAQWALNKSGSQGVELVEIIGPDGEPMRPATQTDETLKPPPGTYILTDESDRVLIKVGFSVSDETVPFVLRYNVAGAAKRWQDTSELYWQFVGDETDVRTDEVHVEIALPGGVTKSDVRAWAHGPLNGVVAIREDGSVTLDVEDLPPNTFVEGRVLFPAEALAKAPVIDEPRADQVAAEEGQLAEEANRERAQARAAVGAAYVFGLAVPFGILGVVVWLWFAFGREYRPTQFPGGYWREIPEGIPTPLVGALWTMGQPDDRALGATLMDLGIQGVVYMQPVVHKQDGFLGIGAKDEQTYQLTVDRAKLEAAEPLERDLAHFVFDETMHADSFTLHDLREEAKSQPRAFTSGLADWKHSVASRAENDLHWVEAGSRSKQVVAILLSIAAVVSAFGATVTTGMLRFAIGILPAVAAFLLAFQIKRRSREAVELYAKYRGLRDYMRDFGRMQEKPPASVVLWERYLVLAAIFGIAELVIQQMRVAVPEVLDDPAFATAYWWASPTVYGDRSSPVGSLTGGFAAAVSAANSEMSSSSGGGGGFSGGGGGGGGGGGFSAG